MKEQDCKWISKGKVLMLRVTFWNRLWRKVEDRNDGQVVSLPDTFWIRGHKKLGLGIQIPILTVKLSFYLTLTRINSNANWNGNVWFCQRTLLYIKQYFLNAIFVTQLTVIVLYFRKSIIVTVSTIKPFFVQTFTRLIFSAAIFECARLLSDIGTNMTLDY